MASAHDIHTEQIRLLNENILRGLRLDIMSATSMLSCLLNISVGLASLGVRKDLRE